MADMQLLEPKRKLRIDLPALEAAFDDASFESHYFLDRQSGQVVMVTGEVRRELEIIYEELNSAGDRDFHRMADAIRRRNKSSEFKEELTLAHRVECNLGVRYLSVPPAHPRMDLRDMEDYVATVENAPFRAKLLETVHGPDHERRFHEALAAAPEELARFHKFKEVQVRERIHRWLIEEGIEPIE